MSAWTDHTGVTTVATPHQVDQFNVDGYFVLDRAFHADTVDDVLAAVAFEAGIIDLAPPGRRTDESPGEVLRRFCTHPLLAGLARDFVGPEAYVCGDDPVRHPTSSSPIAFTRDTCCGSDVRFPRLTCWIALTDFTLDSGCLQIERGGHRSDRPPSDPRVVVDVEARAGSVVVMSSLTPRRLRPTDASRPSLAYSIQYVRDVIVDLDELATPSRRQIPVVRGGQLVGPS